MDRPAARTYDRLVGGEGRVASPGRREVSDLLPLALSRPHEALAQARAVLKGRPGPFEASVAHHAAGIVLREFGDVKAGVRELRAAVRLARQAGSAEREADALAGLGVGLVYAGRTADGLAALDRALERSTGAQAGHMLHRRAIALWTLGRHTAALDDESQAISLLGPAGDPLWTARALNGRGLAYLAVGSCQRADADFVAAVRLFDEISQELEAAHAVENRGLALFALGDLPAALAILDEAAARYRPLNVPTQALCADRCAILLAAGLASDALAEADAGVRDIERLNGRFTKKAELLLMAANCALAAAQPQAAIERAQDARRLFRSQQSAWWQAHAGVVILYAKFVAGSVSARVLRDADRLAADLEALGSGEATRAHLLAGRVALRLGRNADGDRHLLAAARSRRRGPAVSRVGGWLSEALRAEAAAEPRRTLAACRRGLEVLDEHRVTLGASELRALATARGAELAAIAQRHAARTGQARLLLAWTERWRATALAVPAVRRPADPELSAGLAALRGVTSRLEQARSRGEPTSALQREQRRLEGVVRASALRARGAEGAAPGRLDLGELFGRLGPARLAEVVDVDGTLHVLVCGAGRVRRFTAGRTDEAVRAADFARFALRRLARGRPGDDLDSALAILTSAGPKLQDTLLGPAARHLGDGAAVIVPPGRLHGIPWALLPALADRVFSVAPSAGAWLRARATPPPRQRHVTLVRGPGLVTDGAEVPLVAPLYDDVMTLSGGDATTEKVLCELDGAWLAHVAAHGSFRADNPMFSSLRMHDGLLSVYDFEQLNSAPYRLVLSSCDSGVLAPTGADELLGLVSSLLPLGTAGIVAGVAQLNDQAVVPLMVELHRHLHAGQTLAEAMCAVRRGLTGEPVEQATAASLITLGAG
jgi:tetratricopeptide (TPR) repeat protein